MENPEVAVPRDEGSGLAARSLRPGMWLALLGIFFFAFTGLRCAAQTNAKNVLVLFTYFGLLCYQILDASLVKDLRPGDHRWPTQLRAGFASAIIELNGDPDRRIAERVPSYSMFAVRYCAHFIWAVLQQTDHVRAGR